jgi:5-methylcytosine-specific restriction endonuclease McrA
MSRPGRDNTAAWRKAKAAAKARTNICALCGYPIDYTLPKGSPYSCHIDHIVPLAHGGDPYDPANLRPVHAICNLRRPNPANERRRRKASQWRSRIW